MGTRLLWWLALVTVFAAVARGVDLPRFWVFSAIWCAFALYASLAADPTLFKERLKPAAPTVDRGALRAIRLLAVASITIALLDVDRYHWSDTVAPAIRVAAMAVFATAMALAARAMVVNRFFSTAVRLQTDRGHRVVSDGPYRIIRHPGYLGMAVADPAAALALGSWWALLPALAYAFLIIGRARMEDAFLHANLDGYREYAERVRFRLVPGLW
jgi:protein-S-isoprenylcysteine O-methyltransferase Ste14